MKTRHLVAEMAPTSWRPVGAAPGVPLTLHRAVFVARDWGGMVVVRVRGELRAVAVDVYALAALDAAFGVA